MFYDAPTLVFTSACRRRRGARSLDYRATDPSKGSRCLWPFGPTAQTRSSERRSPVVLAFEEVYSMRKNPHPHIAANQGHLAP